MFPLNCFGLLEISLRNSILLTVFLAGVIYYNFKRWKIYVLASKLEGPSSFPIIGCAHHFYGLDTSGNSQKKKISKISKNILRIIVKHC